MDLGLFFDLNHRSSNSRDKRVLIFDHGEILSGFVVDSVHGMQYFAADSFKEKYDTKLEKTIRPFVKGSFEKNDKKWNVFDTFSVTDNQKFLEVAVR
jgi:twitching motility protein PilI